MAGGVGGTVAAPVPGAPVLYLSRESYGRQVASTGGTDSLLAIETPDNAVVADAGIIKLRRVFLTIGMQFSGGGNNRIIVTPIVDFNIKLPAFQFSFPGVPVYQIHELELVAWARCTWVRLRIDVLERTGRLEFMRWNVGYLPVVAVAPAGIGLDNA
jgi:hypothetical protein